jgi:hypothetical protein
MAEQNVLDKYLNDRYDKELNWYDAKSIHNQKWAKRYQVTIIILSVLTPVFAASGLKWPTLISSISLSVAVGILKYCKFEELWQSYRTTCETLKKEKVLFESKISPYDKSDAPVKMFIIRAESMISKENTAWIQMVSQKDEKEDKG